MAETPLPRRAAELDPWEASTWEGNRRWRLARALEATPLERLIWLEEALELAWRAGALSVRRPSGGG